MKLKKIVTILFLMILCITLRAQSAYHRLDSLFNNINQAGELSGAVLVMDSSKVVYEKYFGYEDSPKKKKIHQTTRFELASVSKQFTAMAIMQLEHQGKLSFKDDIKKYFPRLKFKNVTIDHLLRHSSGISDFIRWDQSWFDRSKINTNDAILSILENKLDSTEFEAGSQFSYSNTNYVLLALIVEHVSNMSFKAYMQKFIFGPSGMKNTSVFSARSPGADLQNYARGLGYDYQTGKYISIDQLPSNSSQFTTYMDGISGAYGISSTAQDLLKWHKALNKETVLPKQQFQQALLVGYLNDGKPNFSDMGGYVGYGWMFIDSTDTNKMHYHTGNWPGYQSILVREPKSDRFVAVLVNKWNFIGVLPLMTAINAILNNRAVPVIAPQDIEHKISLMEYQVRELIGQYSYTDSPALIYTITADNEGRIFAQLGDQPAVEVLPKSDVELFYTVIDAKLKFERKENKIYKLTLFQNGQELKFLKK